jgi:hypothetical protein
VTPVNLPGLTVTAEQLGPIWTPLPSRELERPRLACEPCPAPLGTKAPSTITKIAA